MDRLGKIGATKMIWSVNDLLPKGGRWVEYLESTGTQWIDTGVNARDTIKIDAFAEVTQTNTSTLSGCFFVINGVESSIDIGYGISAQRWFMRAFSSGTISTQSVDSAWKWSAGIHRFYLDCNRAYVEVDGIGETRTKQVTGVSSVKIPMFARKDSYGVIVNNTSGFRIYKYNISDGTTLARNFRPIAIGTTGYMLDLVSGEYLPYDNKGTGDFVIGPDISAPAMGGGGGNIL